MICSTSPKFSMVSASGRVMRLSSVDLTRELGSAPRKSIMLANPPVIRSSYTNSRQRSLLWFSNARIWVSASTISLICFSNVGVSIVTSTPWAAHALWSRQ